MISKGKKIILITIGALIVILVGMLGNYYLDDDRDVDDTAIVEEENTAGGEVEVAEDEFEEIRNAQASEKLDYKNIMSCVNEETNKGCVMQNNGNEVMIYNTSVTTDGDTETIRVDVYLNGTKLDVYNEPLHDYEIAFGALTDNGLFLSKGGTLSCNQTLYIFDLSGNPVGYDFGNYNLCNLQSNANVVTLDLDHKTIWSEDTYTCSEKDDNYINNNGDIDVKLTYEASVSGGEAKFTTISSQKYSTFCANGGA